MTMVGTRVLLIDDEPGILETLSQILADEGYVVVSAPEGEEALDIADMFPPDVVVTDLRLPGLDGIATVAHIRNHLPHVDAILISGYLSSKLRGAAVRVGFRAILEKPINVRQLLAALPPAERKDRRRG
jgi:two-component system, NtrC family, nitrogen regulation response regulator NtrX